uniref:DEDD_Tnp_IS110 domain-containing protein n=1 Tax=Mesocestoides corti TaxID=53468 RepID=A0A5K3FN42_MESCO
MCVRACVQDEHVISFLAELRVPQYRVFDPADAVCVALKNLQDAQHAEVLNNLCTQFK